MNLRPFLEADPVIQIHAICGILAFVVGSAILWRSKGTVPHKNWGKLWVVLMLVVALSSLFIHELKTWGNYSAIHLISIYVVGSLFWAIYAVRKGNIRAHKFAMQGMFLGGLVIAGGLSFMPGRIFHRVMFDDAASGYFTQNQSIAITMVCVIAGALVISAIARSDSHSQRK